MFIPLNNPGNMKNKKAKSSQNLKIFFFFPDNLKVKNNLIELYSSNEI
jgi:hypothetical protein